MFYDTGSSYLDDFQVGVQISCRHPHCHKHMEYRDGRL